MLERMATETNAADAEAVEQAVRIARTVTWDNWRDVFEHTGPLSTNPILADDLRFRSFCANWRVARTIRRGHHDELRRFLADSPRFAAAVEDDTGRKLDQLEANLRLRFGTYDGTRPMISVFSKVASFLKPAVFVAWDQHAKRGLNRALGRSASAHFDSYSQYLADFNTVWDGSLGNEIREATERAIGEPLGREPRFQRRVLDLYLMTMGGHNHEPDKPLKLAATAHRARTKLVSVNSSGA